MAEKDRKPDVPIIPGQVYIEVEYDYEYEAKDRNISIKQGEIYILLKKTNNDWWQVKKDESSKPFYLPAQYVKELPRKALMPPVKRVPSTVKAKSASLGADAKLQLGSNENISKPLDYMSSFKSSMGHELQTKISSENQITHLNTSQTQSEDHFQGMVHSPSGIPNSAKVSDQSPGHGESETQYSRVADPNPILGQLQDFDALEVDKVVHEHSSEWGAESSEKHHQDSESGDEYSSSSTEQLQTIQPARSESPVYANLQELKISQANLPPAPNSPPVQTHGEWEVHKDTTGRTFYYHKGTQERSWKPPRWTRDSVNKEFDNQGDSINRGYLITEENCRSFYSSHSDNQFDLPPRGWSEELDDRGQTLYVNEYTNEKWMKHIDEQGRPYYYRADGSKSEWELPPVPPQYNFSAKQQEVLSKSRSLDRKPEPLVLTNWRHSTYGVGQSDLEKFTSKKHKRNSSEHLSASSSYLFSQHPDQEPATSPKLIHDNNNEPPSSPKSPQPSSTVSEKYGLLYMTKITENGKKVRKNWTSSWTVLQGSSLLFAKNQGSATGWKFGNTQSKPEFTVDLKGAAIEWASKDKSSKKNVIELRTRQGTELLIQLDNDNFINEWYKALEETISNQTESDDAADDDIPESPGIEKHDKDKNNKDLKKSRPIKSSGNVDNADQKKTKTKLKKFLTRRPTLQAVRDKGYIKDQVFGCNLSSLCQREGTTVPKFVTMCIDHVEKEGLNVDGLYRVSGNLAVIQKLRFAVNHDEKLDLKDNKWEDINVITGALKMLFRELPEPLFTYHLFNDFINAIKSPDYKQRTQGIIDLIRQLPKPNHDTMQILFQHLVRVVECGEVNRMTTQSIAIVFGPTLLRPEKEIGNIAVHMVYQNQIVELILTEYETVFGRS